jgi:hypothetical protein
LATNRHRRRKKEPHVEQEVAEEAEDGCATRENKFEDEEESGRGMVMPISGTAFVIGKE